MQNDLDAVQLLEKQYQEKLEEEIAKVLFLFWYFTFVRYSHFYLPFLTIQTIAIPYANNQSMITYSFYLDQMTFSKT